MTEKPNLDAAYALQTPDDSRALYADWAETYDSAFVAESDYVLHIAVAHAFAAAGGKGAVLDVGAGTGICGEALAKLGVDPIIGTDISPEMLDRAKSKGVYADLFTADILAGLPVKDGTYPGIVSSGTFTLGHVGPEGLDEVVRLLASGGLAVISVRDTHFEKSGFAEKIAQLEPLLSKASQTIAPIYGPAANEGHSGDKAVLLHLWKA